MASELTKKRVLLVGDDASVRLTLVALLRGIEVDVFEATDAARGLQSFEAQKPDAVLIDLAMPGRNGLELLEEIKRRAKRTPVIVISGIDKIDDTIEALRRGAWDYLAKPIHDIATLEDAVFGTLEWARTMAHYPKPNESEDFSNEIEKRIRQLEMSRDRLRQTEKLRAIGQLAGGVAHDFNNLLGGISGYAELARLHVEDGSKPAKFLDGIVAMVRSASDLNSKLLSFSRMGPVKVVAFDINEVVRDVVDLISHSFDKKIEVEASVAHPPQFIRADMAQLESALINLAVNARDAMPEGGKLTMGTSRHTIARDERAPDEPPAGQYVRVIVRDTGVGMAPETVEHVFEPFFSTKEGHWTGLGLAVVHSAVEEMGGYIRVESAPGQGTTVALFLPPYSK